MGRKVNIFLVNMMCLSLPRLKTTGIDCVLEHRGELSPRARGHGSVPGGGG